MKIYRKNYRKEEQPSYKRKGEFTLHVTDRRNITSNRSTLIVPLFGMVRSIHRCPVLKCVRGKSIVKVQVILRKEEPARYIGNQKRCVQTGICSENGLSTQRRFATCHGHVQGKPNPLPPPRLRRFCQHCKNRSFFNAATCSSTLSFILPRRLTLLFPLHLHRLVVQRLNQSLDNF